MSDDEMRRRVAIALQLGRIRSKVRDARRLLQLARSLERVLALELSRAGLVRTSIK